MSYQITKVDVPYTAQRVTISSQKPVGEVIAALDIEVDREGAGFSVLQLLGNATSKAEIDETMAKLTDNGKRDFVLFSIGSHSRWLNVYFEDEYAFPESYTYTIGNPLIAQGMMSQSLEVGLNVPPKLFIQASEDESGTKIIYDLPSSVIAHGTGSLELREQATNLDGLIEGLLRRVLS